MPADSQQRRSQTGSRVRLEVCQTSRRVSTIHVDSSSSTSVITVIAMLAPSRPSQANGLNTIAASGDR